MNSARGRRRLAPAAWSIAAAIAIAVVVLHTRAGRAADAPGERFEIAVGGVRRIYYVYSPSGLERDEPSPAVLNFHGGGGTAGGTARLSRMNAVADAHSFRVVYPEGVGRNWNDTRGMSKADDVDFTAAILDRLPRAHNVDPKRVYATGMSNGGFFSTRLACELSDRIAAIAVVAATMPEPLAETCKPSRPVPALFFFGDKDPVVRIDGGDVAFNRGRSLSLAATVEFWRRRDGIALPPRRDELSTHRPDDGTSVSREISASGTAGSEVALYVIHGGGHTWPGGRPYLPLIVGVTSTQIDASDIIWDFFARHPMP